MHVAACDDGSGSILDYSTGVLFVTQAAGFASQLLNTTTQDATGGRGGAESKSQRGPENDESRAVLRVGGGVRTGGLNQCFQLLQNDLSVH